MWANTLRADQKATNNSIWVSFSKEAGWFYLIKAGERGGEGKRQVRREMKQFCPYLLCYLAGKAQINYSHLLHAIHYSSCKHISQIKSLRHTWLPYHFVLSATGRLGLSSAQTIREARPHLWDMVPAACSTDSCLPGSLNVWDLSVSISQLISLVHLAATCLGCPFILLPILLLLLQLRWLEERGWEGGGRPRIRRCIRRSRASPCLGVRRSWHGSDKNSRLFQNSFFCERKAKLRLSFTEN